MFFDVLSGAFILLPPLLVFMVLFKVVELLPTLSWAMNVTVTVGRGGDTDTALANGRSGCGQPYSQVLEVCQVLQPSESLHP